FAAIGGAEEAALAAGCVQMANGGDEGDIGIFGIDGDFANVLGAVQTNVGPGFSSVDGFVHAIAEAGGVAEGGFARAHVDGVRCARGNGDGADRCDALRVEDGEPDAAGIDGFPDTAVD